VSAYYNEFDPGAAAWLRELMAAGEIPAGDIDTRSIKDVEADDLRGYDQCHFFAGIGVWPYALRRAGWADDRPVWTGSCPCQPFSGAGKGLGFQDPRHLWPDFLRLIAERRPHQVFGEQVDKAYDWVDLVRTDLERLGAAFASIDLPAAGFFQGAHIRQRFYWLADLYDAERWADVAGGDLGDWPAPRRIEGYGEPGAGLPPGGLAHHHEGLGQRQERDGEPVGGGGVQLGPDPGRCGDHGGLALAHGRDAGAERQQRGGEQRQQQEDGFAVRLGHHHHQGQPLRPLTVDERGALRVEGPASGASGALRGCDWLLCTDARVRPVEAGTFPLAATTPGRVGRLRGYGNALDAEAATAFVEAFLQAEVLL
jgi:DNA (cytosine-5)-methyltransferase 1